MTTNRIGHIASWILTGLFSAFLLVASAVPKLFLATPGSALEPFMRELGAWDIRYPVGILEAVCAVLLLIPQTATVGFILAVGLLGGALATVLTHSSEAAMPLFPVIMLAILTFCAYFRSPELLLRVRGKLKSSMTSIWAKLAGWVPVVLIVFMNVMSGVMKFVIATGSPEQAMLEKGGFWAIRYELGFLQLVISALLVYPRTSTIGFVLMVGYMGGAWADNLTHGLYTEATMFYVVFALLMLTAWFRNPELTWRLRGKPMPQMS